MTPLSCFPQSMRNSLDLRTPVLLCLRLDLNRHGGVDPLAVFPRQGTDNVLCFLYTRKAPGSETFTFHTNRFNLCDKGE